MSMERNHDLNRSSTEAATVFGRPEIAYKIRWMSCS